MTSSFVEDSRYSNMTISIVDQDYKIMLTDDDRIIEVICNRKNSQEKTIAWVKANMHPLDTEIFIMAVKNNNYSSTPKTNAYSLAQLLPGVNMLVSHPVDKVTSSLQEVIISLNDSFRWTREQIADWIETLDEVPKFEISQSTGLENEEAFFETPRLVTIKRILPL